MVPLAVSSSSSSSSSSSWSSQREALRWMTLVAAAANVVSVLYYLRLREEGADDLRSGRNMRSPEFVGEKWRTIHIVGEQSYQWREKEFQGGFEHCPNYRNCKVRTHVIDEGTNPINIPNRGDAVVFTGQALLTHPSASYWSEVASLRGKGVLWALQAARSPFELPLDFLSFRNFGFNFTISYKQDADIFAPYNFWQCHLEGRGRLNPKLRGIQTNVVPNKTHEVLWVVPGGPCLSVNRRMHYAKELGQHIGLDIVGHCLEKKKEEEEGGKAGGWQTLHLEWSSHPGGRGSGIPKDYKYQLALEEISCVDFVTNVYFGVAERMETVPIAMGAQKSAYSLLSPPSSFLHVDDFGGPAHLAQFLREMDDASYNAFFDHVGTGHFELPVPLACRLCDAVNYFQSREAKSSYYNAQEFKDFWSVSNCNTNRLDEYKGWIQATNEL